MFGSLTPVWHVEIFENRITLREPKTGMSGERIAEHHFSKDGLLIADDQILEHELGQLIRSLFRPTWLGRYPVMEVVRLERPVSGEEMAALRTALMNAGASKVVLPPAA